MILTHFFFFSSSYIYLMDLVLPTCIHHFYTGLSDRDRPRQILVVISSGLVLAILHILVNFLGSTCPLKIFFFPRSSINSLAYYLLVSSKLFICCLNCAKSRYWSLTIANNIDDNPYIPYIKVAHQSFTFSIFIKFVKCVNN